jgi:glycosyltransferase involved in cell wall biosynthesis
MLAAIDATPLTLSSGGLVRYTRELSLALARTFPDDRFLLASDQPFGVPPEAPANLSAAGGPRGALERRWWLWGLERELARRHADLFHGTNFAVPYFSRRASVMTLHDLSPWMNPRWHHAAARVRARTPLLLETGRATMILAVSEAVRRRAMERFRIAPQRIVAVPLGGLPPNAAVIAPPQGAPYFLFVGTLEPRKNVEVLLEAWRALRQRHAVDLVLAGRVRADFSAPLPEPGLRLLGEVPDEQLPGLYAGAVALVYPSHYEGFGLPVLEAMQCGAFAITSRDAALLEVAGDASVAVDGEKELVQAMEAALTRPELVREWRERATRRGREFTWERTARLTREVYDEARKRFAA